MAQSPLAKEYVSRGFRTLCLEREDAEKGPNAYWNQRNNGIS